MTPDKRPMLTGYRVLDICQIVAGPTCTRLLAEAGAEVIKVELAPGGDRGRSSGLKPRDPRHKGSTLSTHYVQHNHSKKSLALDLRDPRAQDVVRRMVPNVDVVVENFAPGVMARYGLSYKHLKQLNPGLVMCSISMAGQDGPLSQVPGFDYMAAAYAGATGLFGEPDRPPIQFAMAIGDSYTGVAAAMAVGFALLHRERTGDGQYIEAALIDAYLHMQEINLPRVSLRGPGGAPARSGSLHPDGGPTGVFRYADDAFVAIMVLPHQWRQLLAAMEMPELEEDPRFATPQARRDHKEDMRHILEGWLSRFPSREAAVAALESHRVPCAPVLSVHEAMNHPHMRERGSVRSVDDRHLGTFDVPGPPARFSAWPTNADLRADLLGEHNESVLREVAGMTDRDIAELYAKGILVRDKLLDDMA
ncbi:CoA transferase [Methylobacterium sp. J-030]|uniref:CaiB/BaiF CoA transferase family protein n=1 Tax=Methylobacterium sp. J-030 TaxID=2836627 RepID=UPI001FBC12FE|nr:CaiB/BaiF CoA-transferase family protein [Methylobacterium sp. J-030]MCJ2072422.1 CoA transferase [Methylobacterium sp. J-030]